MRSNFSEIQLQTLVNMEIHRQFGCIPIIPNLREEKRLSWDTGFHIPCLDILPSPDQKGCNLFIQYKLSEFITGLKAKEYKYWNKPFFRFQIPYGRDYSQFMNLKKLAARGFSVYYSTNIHVTEKELIHSTSSKNLHEETPFLDVAKIINKHSKVTFTSDSTFFRLHSEIEQIDIIRLKDIYVYFKNAQGSSLKEDVQFFRSFIEAIERDMDGFQGPFVDKMNAVSDLPESIRWGLKASIVSEYLQKYFGVFWFKFIKSPSN